MHYINRNLEQLQNTQPTYLYVSGLFEEQGIAQWALFLFNEMQIHRGIFCNLDQKSYESYAYLPLANSRQRSINTAQSLAAYLLSADSDVHGRFFAPEGKISRLAFKANRTDYESFGAKSRVKLIC